MWRKSANQMQIAALLSPFTIFLIAYGIDHWLLSVRMAPWTSFSTIILAWAPPLANLLIASLLLVQAWLVIWAANSRWIAAIYLAIGLLFGLVLPGVFFSFPASIFIPYDSLLGRLIYPDTALYLLIFVFMTISGGAGLSVRRSGRV